MVQFRVILRMLGFILLMEVLMQLVCLGASLIYKDSGLAPFAISSGITCLAALFMIFYGKKSRIQHLSRKEGYILVTTTWTMLGLFGTLPFLLGGYTPSIVDAFFESVSGITSTGASIIGNLEEMPESILLWRALTQWVGGLGIILFTIALLPIFGVGGLQMFAAEAANLTPTRVTPRIGQTARNILSIYLGLTLLLGLMLHWGGMNFIDSLCHSLTTVSSGGFSTRQESIAYYHSSYIEYVTIVFMFISGINFNLLILSMGGKIRKLLKDEEFRLFVAGLVVFTIFISILLYTTSDLDTEESIRRALFQVVSLATSTGLASDNMVWVPAVSCLLGLLQLMGACAGSTTGGIKEIRLLVMSKVARNEFRHILHPSAFLPVRLSGKAAPQSLPHSVMAFCFFYVLIMTGSAIFLSAMGSSIGEAISASISAIGNSGPIMGTMDSQVAWAALPAASKWVAMVLMLLGRLEILAFILLLTPDFWKKA